MSKLTTAERNKLPVSAFGLPKLRKFPLIDKEHVLSAIKFYHYADDKDKPLLAKKIRTAMKKFDIPAEKFSEDDELITILDNLLS